MIDYAQRPEHLKWAESLLGQRFDARAACWLTSLDQTGKILGVVIFSRFTTGNCEITVASVDPRFISKRFAFAVAAYPFLQLDCRRVTAFIAVENAKSLSLAQRLGFRIEGTARDWFPTGDAHILGLLRQDCKFAMMLKEQDGQPRTAAST
jgi:RimJ/RimL family protein N-acetyltransferase